MYTFFLNIRNVFEYESNSKTLLLLGTDEPWCEQDELTEEVPKRNGGYQEVSLTSVLHGVNSGTKQTCQQLADVKKQVCLLKTKLFESEQRLNNLYTTPNDWNLDPDQQAKNSTKVNEIQL